MGTTTRAPNEPHVSTGEVERSATIDPSQHPIDLLRGEHRATDLLKRDHRPLVAAAQWVALTAVCVALLPWLLIIRATDSLDLKRRSAALAAAALVAILEERRRRPDLQTREDHGQ